jgi:hypothetical protein
MTLPCKADPPWSYMTCYHGMWVTPKNYRNLKRKDGLIKRGRPMASNIT